MFQRTAVIDHVLSRFPCHQVNFWAKVIAVLAMIETDMSILKTISLAFCDLRAGNEIVVHTTSIKHHATE